MNRCTTWLAACGLVASAGIATLAMSQPAGEKPEKKPGEEMADPMGDPMNMDPKLLVEMMKASGTPGPEHEAMKKMAGDWSFEARFMMAPGAEPEVSKGTAKVEQVLNGLALLGRTEMEFSFAGQKLPMQGISLMGYNRATGEYESVWMDSLDPIVLMQKGEMQGEQLVLVGSGKGAQGEYKMKNVYTFQDDGHYTLEFYQPDPTNLEMPVDEWAKIGSIEYTRR